MVAKSGGRNMKVRTFISNEHDSMLNQRFMVNRWVWLSHADDRSKIYFEITSRIHIMHGLVGVKMVAQLKKSCS